MEMYVFGGLLYNYINMYIGYIRWYKKYFYSPGMQ